MNTNLEEWNVEDRLLSNNREKDLFAKLSVFGCYLLITFCAAAKILPMRK